MAPRRVLLWAEACWAHSFPTHLLPSLPVQAWQITVRSPESCLLQRLAPVKLYSAWYSVKSEKMVMLNQQVIWEHMKSVPGACSTNPYIYMCVFIYVFFANKTTNRTIPCHRCSQQPSSWSTSEKW